MLTDPNLKSGIFHEKYSNDDFHLFDKSGKDDPEPVKKRDAKLEEKNVEIFQDLFVSAQQLPNEKDDFLKL